MIVARTLRLVIVGVVPGLLLASAFGRWVQPLLYRTSGFDPLSYVAAASAMLTVAAVASLLPARRVASAAPVAALRGN
jgi:ABC-type antimicrobial peptide transport system permease subunit